MEHAIIAIDDQLMFSAAGVVAGLVMLVLTRRALSNLGRHSRASMAMVLPEEGVERSMLVMVVAMAVMVAGLFMTALGTFSGPWLDTVSRLAVGVGIAGLTVFLYAVERATDEEEFEGLIGEIVEYSSERGFAPRRSE